MAHPEENTDADRQWDENSDPGVPYTEMRNREMKNEKSFRHY